MSDRSISQYDKITAALVTGVADDATLRAIMSIEGHLPHSLERTMLMALSDTSDARLRNALAIALAEARSKEGIYRIIQLMTQPKTAGARSTLLYALHKLQVEFDPVLLAFLMVSETPETREEAFMIFEEQAPQSSPERQRQAGGFLSNYLVAITDPEQRSLINDALDVLRPHALA